ncbi:MAG: IMP cyclohydrolase [Eubacterium sp.]|nr:IMP cyclohydrolase [Eubacterium sp.]
MEKLTKLLQENAYPGRGIALGESADGKHAVIVYFIMGRSENSRNRIFVEENEGIRTEAFDPSKMKDPSLIIYAPVRVPDTVHTIVTNGDQTDTIYDGLKEGCSFEDSLRTREFEPDGPNYTPRISGLVTVKEGAVRYQLSILKSNDGNPEQCRRFFFDYTPAAAGEGHFLSTYAHDGDPLPSFPGEPIKVEIPDDIDAFTADVWNSLNEDNKVSLFVRYIDKQSGKCDTRICNRHCKE